MDSHQNPKVSSQQLAAKKYIEENDLENTVSEMLNSLVHEKTKQPVVYMIKYLAGLLSEEERKQNGLVIPEPYPKGKPIVKYPTLEKSDSLLRKYLTRTIWTSIKYNKTKYGGNIMNVIKLGESNYVDSVGCILTDGDCINTFGSLLYPILYNVHNYEIDSSVQLSSVNEFHPSNEFRYVIGNVNPDNFPYQDKVTERIISLKFSYSRNLQDIPFTGIMTTEKRQCVENAISKAIIAIQDDAVRSFRYLKYKENEQEIKEILWEINFNENLMTSAGLNHGWPDNRGIYVTPERDVMILVNFIDHLQIVINNERKNSNRLDIIKAYNSSIKLIKVVENHLKFEFNKYFGYLTTCPALIGTGLAIGSEIELTNLTNSPNLTNLLEQMKFDSILLENSSESPGILKTRSFYKLSYKSEVEFYEDYYAKISGIINLDRDKQSVENLNLSKLNLNETADSAIKKAYDKSYEEYKYILSHSGYNLNTFLRCYLEDPKSPFGILFTETLDYKTFNKFVREYIYESQNFDINELDHIHKVDEHKNFIDLKTKGEGKHISTHISLIRNIVGFPFVTSNNENNSGVEQMILKCLENMKMKNFDGKYIPMNNDEINKIIEDNNIYLFHNEELRNLNIHQNFPKNRGIIIFQDINTCCILNDIDHLKFQIHIKDDQLQNHFVNVLKLSNEFSKQVKFIYDKKLGFLTACPRFVGTGLIIKSILKLPNMTKNEEKMKLILNTTDFAYRILNEGECLVELTNKYTIGRSESDLLTNLIFTINDLFENDAN